MRDMNNPAEKTLDALHKKLSNQKFHDYEFPKVSVIVPTFNCAQSIALTLDSLLMQEYPDYEILVIDADSTDRTLEIVNGYRSEKIRLYSVTSSQRYEILNKGISHAKGEYLNFLFPGDFYIYRETLKTMMTLILEHEKPQLAYCGTLLRDGKSEVKILFRTLSLDLLKKGQQPTSLQSCWFKSEAFRELGKFNPSFRLRGGFEFMCRFSLKKDFRAVSIYRVLTDYDLRWVTRRMVLRHFWETLRTIGKYFGLFAMFAWLFKQKDGMRFFKLWMRSLKIAFLGR
jgi:glycosyltransferase involved in cell wall biosynthesis